MSRIVHTLSVILGASGLTLLCFMVLPMIQAITQGNERDLTVRAADTASLPPPPSAEEPEPEPEPEPHEEPPELEEEIQPLNLSQLELALSPGGFGSGWSKVNFELKIGGSAEKAGDALFSLSDLDQKPRAIYQPGPVIDDRVRRKAPGKVYVLFIISRKGKVENPIVQSSTHEVFNGPALAAIRKWKFEPGMRSGKAVRFRMRVPITFPKGL